MDVELAALKAALLAARADVAAARAEQSSNLALIAHLKLQIEQLNRDRFGPRSERTARLLDQMELQLEELEASATEDELAAEIAAAKTTTVAGFTRTRSTRRPFPDHLPRERLVVPSPAACPCCGGTRLSKLGEDTTETLEVVPRQWKVIQHVREKFSCRDCERISQPPAPFHVTPRGWAGPNLLAMILFEKFGQHQPLNRQAERYSREGVPLSLSTLADQVGACTAILMPLFQRLQAHVMAAARLHGDDTTVPVLARSKTDIARLWVYVRDDRPFGGPDPPGAVFYYSRDRGGEHPQSHLAGYAGILQADAYAAMASSTSPAARPDRSWKRRAGLMRDGSFSCWPMSRAARAGRRRARLRQCCRRSASRPSGALTPCSTSNAISTATAPKTALQAARRCRPPSWPNCTNGSASSARNSRAAMTSPAPSTIC